MERDTGYLIKINHRPVGSSCQNQERPKLQGHRNTSANKRKTNDNDKMWIFGHTLFEHTRNMGNTSALFLCPHFIS